MNLFCKINLHHYVEGVYRVAGKESEVLRRCSKCKKLQKPIYGYREIKWVDFDGDYSKVEWIHDKPSRGDLIRIEKDDTAGKEIK